MGAARPLHKVDSVDWEARCRRLEIRDAERARQLAKANAALLAAQRQAAVQLRLRVEAEANAKRFHAQALKARADLLKTRTA